MSEAAPAAGDACRLCISWRESFNFACPAHAPPCPGCKTSHCEPWTSKRVNCSFTTPESRALETLAELLKCASLWEPRVRLLGNNRACDIVHALSWALAKLAKEGPL